MIKFLLDRYVVNRRPPDFLIGPSHEDPHIRRWWVIPRNKWFNIYLHHMLHDDDDRAPHDHPWPSLSLCLDGVIQEIYRKGPGQPDLIRILKKSQCFWRGPNFIHRLEFPDGEAWTLFITGPVVRTWGFWFPLGFVLWKEFVDQDNKGKPGRGCGEVE